jgi:hypothetical protein
LLIFCTTSYAQEYSVKEICNAIYIIEGKEKARQPYGIETIKCNTKIKCEQICINTVNNTWKRFNTQIKEKDFYTFLAKRYCPYNWQEWKYNLQFYLTKEK